LNQQLNKLSTNVIGSELVLNTCVYRKWFTSLVLWEATLAISKEIV
ncbi:110_t:CDS:2, partial [Cetraspora pellucida]